MTIYKKMMQERKYPVSEGEWDKSGNIRKSDYKISSSDWIDDENILLAIKKGSNRLHINTPGGFLFINHNSINNSFYQNIHNALLKGVDKREAKIKQNISKINKIKLSREIEDRMDSIDFEDTFLFPDKIDNLIKKDEPQNLRSLYYRHDEYDDASKEIVTNGIISYLQDSDSISAIKNDRATNENINHTLTGHIKNAAINYADTITNPKHSKFKRVLKNDLSDLIAHAGERMFRVSLIDMQDGFDQVIGTMSANDISSTSNHVKDLLPYVSEKGKNKLFKNSELLAKSLQLMC